jgi:MFS family permease
VTPAPSLLAPAGFADRLEERGVYPRWVLWVALTGLFATTFPITVLTLAIPSMAEDFGVPETSLALLITLPTVCSALALPILGKLGDLHGHRKVFLLGFAVSMVTTALTATAASAVTLIAWRTVTQVIGGATQPSSLALINSSYPPEQRSKAMGWWAMTAAGAPVIGLVIGGPLVESIGWQMVFILQAACMVVPVAASWLVLRETPRRAARFDLPGAGALALGVAGVMIVMSDTGRIDIPTVVVVASVIISPLAFIAFVAIERRAEAPLLPLDFFRRRDFSASVVTSFLSSAAYMGAYFLATLMVVKLFGYSESAAVPILLVRPLAFAVSSPLGGWFTGRVGNRIATVVGCLVLAAGLGGIALGAAGESLLVVVAVGFVLQGVGYGLLRPPISTALANAVDQVDLGIAAASERLMGQIGFAFGVMLLTTVYADTATPGRFTAAFGVGAAIAVVAAVVALAMRPGRLAGLGDDRSVEDGTQLLEELAYGETGGGIDPPLPDPVRSR